MVPKLAVVCLSALAAIACAAETPTYPPPVVPAHGAAATLELNALNSGRGPIAIGVRVLDAYGSPVQTTVELESSAGLLSASSVTTNQEGRASASLTAPAGVVTVSARVGQLRQQTLVSVQ